jgi:release factor glutamine methyltransferase
VFDVIVANPPYVAAGDPHLSEGDLRFEPAAALCGGADGLEAIRHIVAQAPAHLGAGSWVFIEHGFDQARDVRAIMQSHGFEAVSATTDLAGIERITGGRLTRSGKGQ